MIRTANVVRSKGFDHGALELEVMAYKFVGVEPSSLVKEGLAGVSPGEIVPILEKLQELSNSLKRRDMIREIAKLDFKLHDMNASALFPELSEAQAKLIDATTYASNKLEDVIPKLRSVQQGGDAPAPGGPKEAPPPPAMEAEEVAPPPVPAPVPAAPAPPAPGPANEVSEFARAI